MIASSLIGAGCGDNAVSLPCRPGYLAEVDGLTWCFAAGRLAFRHSTSVAMPIEEVNDYYFLLRKPWVEHPILRYASIATDLETASLTSYRIWSTYPPLVTAWSEGRVRTGDPAVDSVFLDNGAETVAVRSDEPRLFGVSFHWFTNWRTLRPLVDALPETRFFDQENPQDMLPYACNNIFLTDRTEDSATLRYVLGWGDCWAGPYWQHFFTATVNADDTVTLVDLGGDPIPDAIYEYAATMPIPPAE